MQEFVMMATRLPITAWIAAYIGFWMLMFVTAARSLAYAGR